MHTGAGCAAKSTRLRVGVKRSREINPSSAGLLGVSSTAVSGSCALVLWMIVYSSDFVSRMLFSFIFEEGYTAGYHPPKARMIDEEDEIKSK